jgi:phosphate transport system substrate-binding protein
MGDRLGWTLALFVVGCAADDRVVLRSKGSDTMVNLMVRLSERYAGRPDGAVVAVSGGGSGTGLAGLIDGTTEIAASSREISPREVEAARARGVAPYATVLAYDGLAVYVHRDNPVERLSLADLRCIYAADGACGEWSRLGVTLACPGGDSVVRLGRHNNSGTYEHFREAVLGRGGRFAPTMEQSGTQQVVDVVRSAPCAIGYGGMGYQSDAVRFVCLAAAAGAPCHVPTLAAVTAGEYPFARPLYLYTDGPPRGAAAAFIAWASGPEGQALVLASGFVPKEGPAS